MTLSQIIAAIWHFVGGRKSLEELGSDLDAAAAKSPEKLDWRNSIVDLLKLTNQNSSLAARKALAKELNYPGSIDGSPQMNIWLHGKVLEKLR
jgi:hypothetical protein